MNDKQNKNIWLNPRNWIEGITIGVLAATAKNLSENKMGKWSWASFAVAFVASSQFFKGIREKEASLKEENIELKAELKEIKSTPITYHTNHVEKLESEKSNQSNSVQR